MYRHVSWHVNAFFKINMRNTAVHVHVFRTNINGIKYLGMLKHQTLKEPFPHLISFKCAGTTIAKIFSHDGYWSGRSSEILSSTFLWGTRLLYTSWSSLIYFVILNTIYLFRVIHFWLLRPWGPRGTMAASDCCHPFSTTQGACVV